VKHEEGILRDYWGRVLRWARKKSARVPNLRLRVNCPLALSYQRKSPRAFMHTLHVPGTVCAVGIACGLSPEHLVGLMLHELGHPMAQAAYGRSEQEDADRAVKEFLGVKIQYKGDLLLEWVSPTVAVRILRV
jgi:hypothetical protein